MFKETQKPLFIALLLFCLFFSAFAVLPEVSEEKKLEAAKRRDERLVKELERAPELLEKALEKVDELLMVTPENIEGLISNSELLVLVFYSPEEANERILKEYAASVLSVRNQGTVGFVDVKAHAQLAKEHSIRYTPMVKLWGRGVPNTQLTKDLTVSPRSIKFVMSAISMDMRRWKPRTSNNLEKYLKTTEKDMFHLVCLCETDSTEYNITRDFNAVRNSLHDVHQLNPEEQASRDQMGAATEPKNQLIIVNNYTGKKALVPTSEVKTPQQLFNYIMASKWEGKIVNLLDKNSEEIKNEIDPFMVYVVARDGNTRISSIIETLESLVQEEGFGLKRVFIVKSSERYVRNHEAISRLTTNKDQVAIVENGYYPPYANVFVMENEIKSQSNILDFYQSYLANEIESHHKAQPQPAEPTQKNLKVLTRSTYWDFINQASKDSVVYYYNAKSNLDKKLGILSAVQERMKANPNVQFGILSTRDNDISDLVRMGSGNQLLLHPAGLPKDLRELHESKMNTQEAILAFIKASTTQEWVEPGPKIHESL